MGLWSKLTGGTPASTTGRTPREQAQRQRDIRAADAHAAGWLRGGGLAPKRKTR
jgi:hypothetical protein